MKNKAGFSLIEVVVVVLVVSLIAAGVVVSQSMVRTSQIQAVMSEYQAYSGAVRNFMSKYRALPGDFAGATALWGEVSGSCTYDPGGVGAGESTETCNGNGDGYINGATYEHITAWRHLGISGFISQNMPGTRFTSSCDTDVQPGNNIPASKLKGAGWNLEANSYSASSYTGGANGTYTYFPMSTADLPTVNSLWLGGSLQDDIDLDLSCARSQIPVLDGEEAYTLDLKNDDGLPATGKIRGQYNDSAAYQTCENGTAYRIDSTGINCSLVFILDQ